MKNIFIVTQLTICFCYLAACSAQYEPKNVPARAQALENGPQSEALGTSDGGGGDLDYSEDEQIVEAVEKVRAFLMTEGADDMITTNLEYEKMDFEPGLRNQVAQIFSQMGFPQNIRVHQALEEMGKIAEERDQYDPESPEWKELNAKHSDLLRSALEEQEDQPETLADLVSDLKVVYEDDQACPAHNNKDADASVSSYSLDATICFSLYKLRRIPPQALEQQVFALWMHELTHAMGKESETLAEAVERLAAVSYEGIMGSKTSYRTLTFKLEIKLMAASNNLSMASALISNHYFRVLKGEEITPEAEQQISLIYKGLTFAEASLYYFMLDYQEEPIGADVFYDSAKKEKRQEILEQAQLIQDHVIALRKMSLGDLVQEEIRKEVGQLSKDVDQLSKKFFDLERAE